MNYSQPIRTTRLGVLLCFVTLTMILGCSPKSSSQDTNKNTSNHESARYSLSVKDPFSNNIEWAAYRESIQMYALHLKPSINLLDKQYEIKIEEYMDGKNLGTQIFDYRKLGVFRNAIYLDSCLHFYGFRISDTTYKFQYSPSIENTFIIQFPLDKKNAPIYKWVTLFEDSRKTFELKERVWQPIFTLTLPYKELCTPNECFYCVLPENVDHYQDWGKTMKLKHYVMFSIRFL